MRVMGKRILIEQSTTKEVSEGGIVLPTTMTHALPYGKVIQIGPYVDETIKVGDVVLFSEIGAIPLGIKKDHVLIEPDDILAILEEGEY